MRSVVVDYVRHAQTQRSGGKSVHVTLDTNLAESMQSSADEIMRMNELLNELAAAGLRPTLRRPLSASASRETADRRGVYRTGPR
jgi:hypothetical protein